MLIADTLNHRIRRVAADGLISTMAGTGTPGFSGDGAPASSAQLGSPTAVAETPRGGFVIADQGNRRVRLVEGAPPPPPPPPPPPSLAPTLADLAPASARPGAVVTLTGAGFGAAEGASVAVVGGVRAGVVSWSDDRIVVVVPDLPDGDAAITVTVAGRRSNARILRVLTSPGQPPTLNPLLIPFGDGRRLYYDSTLAIDPDTPGLVRSASLEKGEQALGPGIRSVLWRFDDESTSTREKGVHTYARPGSYTVRLTVRDARGSRTSGTSRVAVRVRRGPPPPLNITIPSQLAFDFGKASLRPESARYLLRVAAVVRRGSRVTVGVYTDSVGPSAFNRGLSLRRARAVRAFLIRRGRVPARVLIARGYGETARFGNNATEAGKQRNRRVVLSVRLKAGTQRI